MFGTRKMRLLLQNQRDFLLISPHERNRVFFSREGPDCVGVSVAFARICWHRPLKKCSPPIFLLACIAAYHYQSYATVFSQKCDRRGFSHDPENEKTDGTASDVTFADFSDRSVFLCVLTAFLEGYRNFGSTISIPLTDRTSSFLIHVSLVLVEINVI